jgi:hypothetical protein
MLLRRALAVDGVEADEKAFGRRGFFRGALARGKSGALRTELALTDPVVLLGAPAGVLAPWAQKYISARILAPPRFEVASALGAACSVVTLSRRVDIVPLPDLKTFRAFLPDRLLDGHSLNTLVAETSEIMGGYMAELARIAGADENCPISYTRSDRQVLTGDGVYMPMGCTLKFTAGRGRG